MCSPLGIFCFFGGASMGRALITQHGFEVLVASGVPERELQLTHDVIPMPEPCGMIRFGSAFLLSRHGVSTFHVLVGQEENLRVASSHAWRRLGLRPISVTSTFGMHVLRKKVGDTVEDGKGNRYLVVTMFRPDVSGPPYTPPENVTHIRKHCA